MYKAYHLDPSPLYNTRRRVLQILYLPRDTRSKGRQVINAEDMLSLIRSMRVYTT